MFFLKGEVSRGPFQDLTPFFHLQGTQAKDGRAKVARATKAIWEEEEKEIKDFKDFNQAGVQAAAGSLAKARGKDSKVCLAMKAQSEAMKAESKAMKATESVEVSATGAMEAQPMMKPSLLLESLPDHLKSLSPFQRLRQCLGWWRLHAPHFILQLINQGVEPNFQGKGLKLRHQEKSASETSLALEVMKDYVEVGAAKEVEMEGKKYLVPWFVIKKVESTGKLKNRLISDCREINRELNPPKFRLDHWKDIFPHLEKSMWKQKWIQGTLISTWN